MGEYVPSYSPGQSSSMLEAMEKKLNDSCCIGNKNFIAITGYNTHSLYYMHLCYTDPDALHGISIQ